MEEENEKRTDDLRILNPFHATRNQTRKWDGVRVKISSFQLPSLISFFSSFSLFESLFRFACSLFCSLSQQIFSVVTCYGSCCYSWWRGKEEERKREGRREVEGRKKRGRKRKRDGKVDGRKAEKGRAGESETKKIREELFDDEDGEERMKKRGRRREEEK